MRQKKMLLKNLEVLMRKESFKLFRCGSSFKRYVKTKQNSKSSKDRLNIEKGWFCMVMVS